MLGLTRRDPPMNEETPDLDDRATAEALAHVANLRRERDNTSMENTSLKVHIEELERDNEFLRRQLTASELRRDMYQRHAVALYTRCVDLIPQIRLLADSLERALSEAKVEARAAAPPQTDVAVEDGLKELVEKLKPEGGQ